MRYRWNPWEDLQREMSSVLESHLGARRPTRDEPSEWGWRPPVDIFEDPEYYLLIAELPGVDPVKVDLRVEDNRLTISGTRQMEFAERKESYHRLEREYGAFARTFSLPASISADKIDAEYKQGLLRVRIPKRPEVQPKQISVRVSE